MKGICGRCCCHRRRHRAIHPEPPSPLSDVRSTIVLHSPPESPVPLTKRECVTTTMSTTTTTAPAVAFGTVLQPNQDDGRVAVRVVEHVSVPEEKREERKSRSNSLLSGDVSEYLRRPAPFDPPSLLSTGDEPDSRHTYVRRKSVYDDSLVAQRSPLSESCSLDSPCQEVRASSPHHATFRGTAQRSSTDVSSRLTSATSGTVVSFGGTSKLVTSTVIGLRTSSPRYLSRAKSSWIVESSDDDECDDL